MHKSKLLYLLGGLNKKEMRELEQFIDSPAFNKDKTIKPLYEQLLRYFPAFDSPRLQKENLANRLYGNAEASTLKKLAYTTSNFIKLVRKYLLWKELEVEEDDRDFLEMKAYKRRNLDKAFFKKGEQFNKRLDDLPYRDMIYFHLKFRLNWLIAIHEGEPSFEKRKLTIKSFIEYLELFFVNAKLFQFNIIQGRKRLFNEKFNLLLEEEIIKLLQDKLFKNVPSLQIQYNTFKLLSEKSPEKLEVYFYNLKALIFNNLTSIRKAEKEEVFLLLINSAVELIKYNPIKFNREVYLIYKIVIKHKFLFVDGYLQPQTLFSYVQSGCELEEVNIVENDFHLFKRYLRKMHQNIYEKLCLSYINLRRGKYNETIILLRDAKPESHYNEITIRSILLMAYHDSFEEELFFNCLENFEAFIRRHKKLSNKKKERHLNFLKVIYKINKNRNSNQLSFSDLKKEFYKYQNISFKFWLARKIEEQFPKIEDTVLPKPQ